MAFITKRQHFISEFVKSTFNSVQLLGEYSDLFGQKNVPYFDTIMLLRIKIHLIRNNPRSGMS